MRWGWWQKHWLRFYGRLSPLEADPLELWVLEWKRQLHITTRDRRHDESSVCVETSYSNKHTEPWRPCMLNLLVPQMCVYINIGVEGWHSILQATDEERSLLWRTLWWLNIMKQSWSDRSHSTCVVYVSPLSSAMFVSSAAIFFYCLFASHELHWHRLHDSSVINLDQCRIWISWRQ